MPGEINGETKKLGCVYSTLYSNPRHMLIVFREMVAGFVFLRPSFSEIIARLTERQIWMTLEAHLPSACWQLSKDLA